MKLLIELLLYYFQMTQSNVLNLFFFFRDKIEFDSFILLFACDVFYIRDFI